MEKSKKHLFERVINYDLVKEINNSKFYLKYIISYFLSIAFLLCISISAIIFGYSTKYWFGIFQITESIIVLLLSLFFFIYFFIRSNKYKIFKKNIYPILIYFSFILITILIVIAGIFTTHYIGSENGTYTVIIDGIIYFIFYIILFFALYICSYYVFLKGIVKAIKENKKQNQDYNKIDKNNDLQ